MTSRAKIGLIGAGWGTSNHLPVLYERDDIELTGVCRLGKDELQQVKNRFRFTHATSIIKSSSTFPAYKSRRLEPPYTPLSACACRIETRFHVLCEKPLTTKADEARKLVEEANRRMCNLVPYGWHYAEFIQEAKQKMVQVPSAISVCYVPYGIAHSVIARRQTVSFRGRSWRRMFDPAAKTCASHGSRRWICTGTNVSFGGLAYWLTDPKPERVSALTSSPTSAVELYDAFSVRFTSGAIGSFSGAGALPENQQFQL